MLPQVRVYAKYIIGISISPARFDRQGKSKKTPLRITEGACRRENSLITGRGGGTADGNTASRSHQEPTINL
jgi:hypothetical protein